MRKVYNLIVMNGEIEYLKRDISDIKKKVEGIDELKAGQARLEARLEGHIEGMRELVKSMSERVKTAEQKAEKTENRLWYVVIAVIIAGGIPSLVAKLLG